GMKLAAAMLPMAMAFHVELIAKTDGFQTQYSVSMAIGTPPQLFDLIVDTGSSDMWVQGIDCTQCFNGPKFNSSLSTTFSPGCSRGTCEYTLAYGSGVSTAHVGQDYIALGTVPLAGKMQFGVVYIEDVTITHVLQNSGILGLGFEVMSFFTHPSPINYISSFALYLDGDKSIMSVNEVMDAFKGPATQWSTIPVEEIEGLYTYWTIGLPEAEFGGKQLCGTTQKRCQAVLDSGTAFIAIPPQKWPTVVIELQHAGCIAVNVGGPFECPDSELPTLHLTLGLLLILYELTKCLGTLNGYEVTMAPSMYSYPIDGSTSVLVGLIESPLELWIFGSLFLQYFYTNFDTTNKQVQMVALATTSVTELVPMPIAPQDQPSYIDQIYDEAALERFLVLVVICASISLIYTLIFRSNHHPKYEHGYFSDVLECLSVSIFQSSLGRRVLSMGIASGIVYNNSASRSNGLNNEARQPRVIISNPDKFASKFAKMIKDGPNQLLFIADFDYTLTPYYNVSGGRGHSCHGMLASSKVLSDEFFTKSNHLFQKFYPIEISPLLAHDEKEPHMIEWWTREHGLFVEYNMHRHHVEAAVNKSDIEFRSGFGPLFQDLATLNVPTLIFSAGLADVIYNVLRKVHGETILTPNLHIVSNVMKFQEPSGKLLGFEDPLIHCHNKNATVLKDSPFWKECEERHNVILLGDSVGDAQMAEGLPVHNIIKIGFLNTHQEEKLGEYLTLFDVVIINDGSLSFAHTLIRAIQGK
ncbi:pyrimidine 5'-nucleotidase (UMPH-1), partial [Thraustotheca clavata]